MRYILGVLGVILVAFVAIILITSRGSDTTGSANSPKKPAGVSLFDYDNGESAVKMTIQGRLVGEDRRQAARVTVTQSQRKIELLSGYEENVAKSETFANTPAAYSTFLRALNNANYTKKRKVVTDDERGTCPTGNRYIYELTKGTEKVQRLWATSCASGDGTFAGSGSLIRGMFRDQIPDYDKFLSGSQVTF